MSHSQYSRVSHFREGSMGELEGSTPKLTPRSSYSTGLEKPPTPKQPTFNYKPVILRAPVLLSLLVFTLALIGALEFAIRTLPHGTFTLKRRDEAAAPAVLDTAHLMRRNDSISSSMTTTASASAPNTQFTRPSAFVEETSTTVLADTTQSAFVDPVSTSSATIYYSKPESAFVDTESTSTYIPSGVVGFESPSAFVELTSSMMVSYSKPQSAFVSNMVQTTITRQEGVVQVTPQAGDGLTWTAQSAATSAFVGVQSTATLIPGGDQGGEQIDNRPNTGDPGNDVPINNNDDGNEDDQEAGFDNQNAAVTDPDRTTIIKSTQVWSIEQTFISTYLAICVAVIYRLLWLVVYNAFNLIDPFRQLMDPKGALAERAFFSFYQSQSNLLGPIPALMKRRWALALVGTAYLITNLLPALAAESIFVETKWDCPNPNVKNTNNPCNPRMFGNVTVLRVMQGLLGFAAVVLLFITSLLVFQKTGLPTKPNSIASIASLMRHPRVVADFSEMPVNAREEHMRKLMEGKRYKLGHYSCANGQSGYGIIPWNGYDSDGFVSPFGTFRHQYTPVDGSNEFADQSKAGLRRFRIQDFVLAFFVLGAFGVVLAYYLDGRKDGFNNFFNSNTFGPRFILTLAGTVIASIWKSVEQDAIVMSPYLRLFAKPSSARSTILMTPSSTPLSSTIRTVRHRYFFAATITLITLLAEGLNIGISGVPYANGQTWMQFIASAYLSLAALSLMIIVTALVIIRRFWEPRIPRKPTTLGVVMSYLCGSRMLEDFEGMDGLNRRTRDQRIRVLWKKYDFKEMVRKDGKLGWTVDEAFDRQKF